MRSTLLLLLLAGLALGCRDSAPRESAASHRPSAATPDALEARARITELLGVGWAHVFAVELSGEVRGRGWVYAPAGDAFVEAVLGGDGGVIGREVRLVIRPMPVPEAGDYGPYALHLRLAEDGGLSYWSVASYGEP